MSCVCLVMCLNISVPPFLPMLYELDSIVPAPLTLTYLFDSQLPVPKTSCLTFSHPPGALVQGRWKG